jgi:lambda family phage portal protein
MGFYLTPPGEDGSILADEKQIDGELITEADPGHFGIIPAGYDFKTFDPSYPHSAYASFQKALLRGVASGGGVSYNTLASDLEGVNFSSIRAGVLEDRELWMSLQKVLFIDGILDDLFSEWLRFALLHRMILLPSGSPMPAQRFEKLDEAEWQGRRWPWVDPLKDMQAAVLAKDNQLNSRTGIASAIGGDIDSIFQDIAAEKELAEELGVELLNNTGTQSNGDSSDNEPSPETPPPAPAPFTDEPKEDDKS